MFMPARVAMALQADGWWVRSKIIWHKPNPMPESVTDRPTSSYEEVFLLTKASPAILDDAEAVRVAQPTPGSQNPAAQYKERSISTRQEKFVGTNSVRHRHLKIRLSATTELGTSQGPISATSGPSRRRDSARATMPPSLRSSSRPASRPERASVVAAGRAVRRGNGLLSLDVSHSLRRPNAIMRRM